MTNDLPNGQRDAQASRPQPVVEIVEAIPAGDVTAFAPAVTTLRINGMDMGHFDGFRVEGASSDGEELLKVTVTLLPSKLVLGIEDGAE